MNRSPDECDFYWMYVQPHSVIHPPQPVFADAALPLHRVRSFYRFAFVRLKQDHPLIPFKLQVGGVEITYIVYEEEGDTIRVVASPIVDKFIWPQITYLHPGQFTSQKTCYAFEDFVGMCRHIGGACDDEIRGLVANYERQCTKPLLLTFGDYRGGLPILDQCTIAVADGYFKAYCNPIAS